MDGKDALHKLIAEIEQGEVVFPTHAHVALQVRLALDDPEIHLEKAASVVQMEPMLAAKVVGLANSVAFNRSGRTISDVRSAVTRLGLTMIRGLSTALIMRQLAETQSTAHETLAARLWEHSSHVAALSHVLARRVSRQNPDMALFAGIVHEVGNFYRLSRAASYPELLESGIDEPWQQGGEALITRAVMKALAVPAQIFEAVETQWTGKVTIPPVNLADTLYLANCLTPIGNPLQPVSADMERTAMLALSAQVIPDKTLAAILEESADELNTLATSLRL